MGRRPFDYTLLVLTIVLVLFGVVMVFSASFYVAENSPNTNYNGYYYFWKQVSGAAIGLVAMIAAMFFDYNKFLKLRYIILGIAWA
jgi:cell division protein FtsW